ncbi:conserved hypothetical protein [Thiocapsa sp. KS1]|nr:hypothetical protein [Thiocapsa sp. KS1]CRI63748.1 conserved hypothetical protein [Thiocapsa sp. KS1]
MTTEERKKPVSERALFARLSRRLAKDGDILKKCRFDSRWYGDFGNYYIVDSRNAISATHVDLEGWAREMGVLQPWERLEDDAQ